MCLSRPAYVLHNEHVGLRVILIIVTLTSWLSSSQGLLSQGAGLQEQTLPKVCATMTCTAKWKHSDKISRATKAENNNVCGSGAETKDATGARGPRPEADDNC